MKAAKEKTIAEYKIMLIEEYSTAQSCQSFRSPVKTQAMFELLWEQKIVPLSPTLWMSTQAARIEFAS